MLTKHLDEVIDRLMDTGLFNSESEVTQAGLRLLEEHELQVERATRADLERILDAYLANPRSEAPAERLHTRRGR